MDFVTCYGLLGFMTAFPTTPGFITCHAVYLLRNHFIKEESMTTKKYLSYFFLFDKIDFVKKGISRHLAKIFESGELDEEMIVAKIAITTQHGAMQDKTAFGILLCCRSRNGVDLAKNTSRFQDIYILLGIGIARHDLFSIFAVDPTLDGIGCIFKAAYFIKYIVANEILIALSSNELKMKSVDPLVHQRIHSFFALCNLIFIHAIDVPNHVQIIQSTIMEKISTFVIIRELTV